MAWGASRSDWAHFALILGLGEDLLPVVSNPHAIISPKSTLKSLGKTPSRYTSEREVVGIANWTELKATDAQLELWSREPDYGICIQTRQVIAIDIDLEDAAEVARITALADAHLGLLPRRSRSGSERLLLPARLELGSKRRVEQASGIVEILARGQQFIAAGTHQGGARYVWVGGLPEEIPEISIEALEAFWQAIGGEAALPRRPDHVRPAAPAAPAASSTDEVATWLEQRGWSRGWGRKGELRVACPWADAHTGDSGETESVYYPAGVGGFAQGHFHCLHAHCADRGDEAFLDAIGFRLSVAEEFQVLPDGVPVVVGGPAAPPTAVVVAANGAGGPAPAGTGNGATPPSWVGSGPGTGLRRGRRGWLATIENVCRALYTPGWWLELGWDTFRDELMAREWGASGMDSGWRTLSEGELIEGRRQLERAGFEPVGADLMRDAVGSVARGCTFDSAVVWLGGLKWDGVGRVGTFLEWYCGATGAKGYLRAVSRYLWTAQAGRVLDPGCQADMVPVLVSARQGVGKTRGLESMAPFPDAYCTIDLATRDADLARRLRGRLVVELNELRGLHTREAGGIKTWITERRDTWIPKYREFAISYPRRCLLYGTTDMDQFLDDPAGNRRWLPFEVGELDREAIIRDRGQLWAEAAILWQSDGVAWQEAERLGLIERDAYEITDIWGDEVRDWVNKQPEEGLRFTLRDLALGIGLDPRTIHRGEQNRLGSILRKLRFSKTRVMSDGQREVYWEKK
jgi:hypothetical protein